MRVIPYRKKESQGSLTDLQNEINQLFDFSFERFPTLREEYLSLLVDVTDDKDNIYVEADVPGFEQADIELNIKGDTLVISAKKEESKEEKKKHYYCCERFQGSLHRTVGLPSSVDSTKTKASYKKGVLKVTLPKKEEAKEKEIKINIE